MQYLSHNFFADADAPYESAEYVIFGVPYDGTTTYLAGTREGPDAIRRVTRTFETYIPDFDIDLTDIPFTDLGNIEPESHPDMVVAQVEDVARDLLADGKIPILLGGEHSVTVGVIRALRPDCYIVCDAHLDLREEYGGSPYNHACVTRRVAELGVQDIFIIGARSGTREEYEYARTLHLYTAEDVRERGIYDIIEEILPAIAGKRTYLSIDADAIDCCLTPGHGTPEPFGLTPFDIRDVIRTIGPESCGFDYVEVCPIDAGQTAAVAGKLVREFIACHWKEKNVR
ncbi:agmatinase [Methanomicrobiaceae archaeon CYW5]|uniref:agmatinase n=1 Tax=Methanovulcanius yangii TaxID=1789227 RepID=UPI0029CA67EB|nr:agmatinase [Methanovulcanius yangii]MBT8507313.1 agmatinase [Methanovulcanius yangii]